MAEELEAIQKPSNREPALLAAIVQDLKAGRIEVEELESINSGLKVLGFGFFDNASEMSNELLSLVKRIPLTDPDADESVLAEIKANPG